MKLFKLANQNHLVFAMLHHALLYKDSTYAHVTKWLSLSSIRLIFANNYLASQGHQCVPSGGWIQLLYSFNCLLSMNLGKVSASLQALGPLHKGQGFVHIARCFELSDDEVGKLRVLLGSEERGGGRQS